MSPVPVDPYNFAAGQVADAEQVDARFAPLYATFNGAIDATNLVAGAVTTPKIADANVTLAKLALAAIGPRVLLAESNGVGTTNYPFTMPAAPTTGKVLIVCWPSAQVNVGGGTPNAAGCILQLDNAQVADSEMHFANDFNSGNASVAFPASVHVATGLAAGSTHNVRFVNGAFGIVSVSHRGSFLVVEVN